MPTSKRRLAHLKNARLASVAHFKKQKLEQAHRFSTEQSRIDDNELSTSDTGNTGDTDVDTDAGTDEEGTWFWNKSANESESDSECSGDSEEEGDLAPKGSRTVQVLGKLAQHTKNQQTVMKIVDIAEYEALLWRWLATKR